MIAYQLPLLFGTLLLLPLATGQHHGFPAAYQPQFYHGHGFPPTNYQDHHRRNLRRQQRRVQNDSSPPPFFDCGKNPLVKRKNGCPCFSAKTISSLMDVEADADSCYFYATAPVNASDQCSHLYPRSASLSASTTYTDTSSYSVSFAVSSNVFSPMPRHMAVGRSDTTSGGVNNKMVGPVDIAPPMQGAGTCSAGVYYSKYIYDQNGSNSNGESHGYDINLSLTKKQLESCLKVLNDVKVTLPKDVCFIDGVGGVV